MTSPETSVLVFKDQAGEYYLLPLETLERGRVPAEHKAALEEQIAALLSTSGEGDDVQGHILPILVGVWALGTGTALGFAITWNYVIPHPVEPAPVEIPVEPEPIR